MAKTYISTDRIRHVFRHENPEEIIGYLKDRHHKLAHKNSWDVKAVAVLVKAGYKVRPTHFRGRMWRYQDGDFIITLSGAVRANTTKISVKEWRHGEATAMAMGYIIWFSVMKDVYGESRFIYGWKKTKDGRVELFTDAGYMYPDDKDILHYQL